MDAFLDLADEAQALNGLLFSFLPLISCVVSHRKRIQVHCPLDSLSVKYTSGPIAQYSTVKAQILGFRSLKQTLTVFLLKPSLLVTENFTSENTLVDIHYLLKHLVFVWSNFLVCSGALIDVIFHKFLSATELNMLKHELWHVIGMIHELDQVLLHDCVLVRGSLQSCYRAISISAHDTIFVDRVRTLTS